MLRLLQMISRIPFGNDTVTSPVGLSSSSSVVVSTKAVSCAYVARFPFGLCSALPQLFLISADAIATRSPPLWRLPRSFATGNAVALIFYDFSPCVFDQQV